MTKLNQMLRLCLYASSICSQYGILYLVIGTVFCRSTGIMLMHIKNFSVQSELCAMWTMSSSLSECDLGDPFFFLFNADNRGRKSQNELSYQVIGIAKVFGFLEWLSLHPIVSDTDDCNNCEMNARGQKMIVFAHHHKVLDKVQVRSSLFPQVLIDASKYIACL